MIHKIGFFAAAVATAMMSGAALAVASAPSNYFLDRDNNPLPYAAMCSVHAYNIGDTVNYGGSRQEEMDRVVALKANLVTREMKKQYDYLDATVKRFQIQLQKAILISQAEASGAPSGSPGGGTSSSVSSGISGTSDCSGKSRSLMVECLRENYRIMLNAANARNINTAFRNQIISDVRTINGITFDSSERTMGTCRDFATNQCAGTKISTQNGALDCLSCLSRAINAISEYSVGGGARTTGLTAAGGM